MTSKREQILAAIASLLTSAEGVGGRVYRSRTAAVGRSESPALIVEPVNDRASQVTSLPTLDWSLTVRVAIVVRGTIPDQVADPIHVDIHSRLMSDLTLGGLAIDIQPVTVVFEAVDADQPAGVVMCDYRVLYRTAVGDLTQL